MNSSVVQIKIDFSITDNIQRFVYVYLILGKHCYLIDAGVKGCKEKIECIMHEYGKDTSDLKAIFLTHSHPDHLGGAYELKQASHCKIYISMNLKKTGHKILIYNFNKDPFLIFIILFRIPFKSMALSKIKIKLNWNLIYLYVFMKRVVIPLVLFVTNGKNKIFYLQEMPYPTYTTFLFL